MVTKNRGILDAMCLGALALVATGCGSHGPARGAAMGLDPLARGVVCEYAGEYRTALKHYRQAARGGTSPIAWTNYGNVCLKLGKREKAAHAYGRALAVDPCYPEALNNLAMLLLQETSRRREALALVRKAVSHATTDLPEHLDSLAMCYDELGHYERAYDCYRLALGLCESGSSGIPRYKARLEAARRRMASVQ